MPGECAELGDAIGADSIDANSSQGIPLIGIVGCPHDYATVDRVHASYQILVDEADILPEVLSARCSEGYCRIEMAGNFQYAGAEHRKDCFHSFYNAMIE